MIGQREKFCVYISNFVFFLTFSVECVFCEKNMFYCMVEKFRVFFAICMDVCIFVV